MPDLKQFRLPDVGEGLTEADILTWSVAPGDRVVVNQTLVEVETAKAAVELPSPFAGIVAALHAEPGETVEVGRAIITIDTAPVADADGSPVSSTSSSPESSSPDSPPLDSPPAVEAPREAVLVGYGPRSGPVRPARAACGPAGTGSHPDGTGRVHHRPRLGGAQGRRVRRVRRVDLPGGPGYACGHADRPRGRSELRPRARAKPPVRKLAKTLGVDLGEVMATGPNGSVSREDVERAHRSADQTGPSATGPATDRGVREERIPIRGVRKHTAAAMVASAFTAPHVTEFITADVTAMMELRERLSARREFTDVKLSPLALVARAAIWAIARTPIVNSSWDEAAGEIVVKHYVNLGIAAATGRGLVVPNVKDADGLSLRDLARALRELAATARAGRTTPGDMSGGTFTITNVGVFGVDTGTPILNPGESAILAFGAVRRAPWVVRRGGEEVIEARWVTQLALSFDHRVVDGEQGSTFLADLAGVLTDPGLALA